MVFKKIIFQNRYVALETPSRPPPFMANTILNFHFDYRHPSLSLNLPTMVNCYRKDRWYTFTLLKRYVVLFWKMKQDHRRWRYHRRLLEYQTPHFKSFLIIKYLGIMNSFGSSKSTHSFEKTFRLWDTWGSGVHFSLDVLPSWADRGSCAHKCVC